MPSCEEQIQIEASLQQFQIHKMRLCKELEQARLDHEFRCRQLALGYEYAAAARVGVSHASGSGSVDALCLFPWVEYRNGAGMSCVPPSVSLGVGSRRVMKLHRLLCAGFLWRTHASNVAALSASALDHPCRHASQVLLEELANHIPGNDLPEEGKGGDGSPYGQPAIALNTEETGT